MITAADEEAIAHGPRRRVEARHRPGRHRRGGQGRRRDHAPDDPGRELARRPAVDRPPGQAVPPAGQNLTAYEKKTGWRYSIICTNIPDTGIAGVPGSHHPQYIDVVHREHACVETAGVRTAKAMGLRNLPSKTWQVNCGWVIAANIAADLAAWTRLLGHCDDPELRDADPDTLRYRVWHLPARLARHARAAHPGHQPRPGPGTRRSWPAGSGSAPCPHPPDQHEPAPATRKEAQPGAVGAGAHPGTPGSPRTRDRNRNGHEIQNGNGHNQ